MSGPRSFSLNDTIGAYFGQRTADPNHRYRSWEHCYSFFRGKHHTVGITANVESCLQLGFYLASWGMYVRRSFLLQKTYAVHRNAIQQLVHPDIAPLWEREFGANNDDDLIPVVLKAFRSIRAAYLPFVPKSASNQPSETLITKVLLGTLSCVPAVDTLFLIGWKKTGNPYSAFNEKFVRRLLAFSKENRAELQAIQATIFQAEHVHYPIMKLVDMYFWQIGYGIDPGAEDS